MFCTASPPNPKAKSFPVDMLNDQKPKPKGAAAVPSDVFCFPSLKSISSDYTHCPCRRRVFGPRTKGMAFVFKGVPQRETAPVFMILSGNLA